MPRSPRISFSAGGPCTRSSARSFRSSRWGTAAPRPATPFSTDCFDRRTLQASAQEITQFVRERVVVKLEALQNCCSVKFARVIGAQHHHRKPLGQRAALVLKVEKGLDRLHRRQSRDRLTEEAERSRPLPRDIDTRAFEQRDEFVGGEGADG